MITKGARPRATTFFDNSTRCRGRIPSAALWGRTSTTVTLAWVSLRLCASAPLRLCVSAVQLPKNRSRTRSMRFFNPLAEPGANSHKIARIQMRNRRRQPFHRQRPKTLPRNNLQQPRRTLPSRSLRKIRDLIIFRRNHAQMRNNCRPFDFCIKTPWIKRAQVPVQKQ